MKKKAIFGGTFNPIHNGHINMAYLALEKLELDEVVFMPSGNPPHKQGMDIVSGEIRLELVNQVVKDEKKFSISDYEIKKKGMSYTYETLEDFNKLFPSVKWHFIVGLDSFMYIEKWKEAERILQNCILVVFSRKGYNENEVMMQKKLVEEKYKAIIKIIDEPILDISSTELRNKVKIGDNISYLTSAEVIGKIKEFKLYK